MTYPNDFTVPAELMEQVQEHGLDVLPELIRIVVNAAMQAERAEHLHAGPYQHTPNVAVIVRCEHLVFGGE